MKIKTNFKYFDSNQVKSILFQPNIPYIYMSSIFHVKLNKKDMLELSDDPKCKKDLEDYQNLDIFKEIYIPTNILLYQYNLQELSIQKLNINIISYSEVKGLKNKVASMFKDLLEIYNENSKLIVWDKAEFSRMIQPVMALLSGNIIYSTMLKKLYKNIIGIKQLLLIDKDIMIKGLEYDKNNNIPISQLKNYLFKNEEEHKWYEFNYTHNHKLIKSIVHSNYKIEDLIIFAENNIVMQNYCDDMFTIVRYLKNLVEENYNISFENMASLNKEERKQKIFKDTIEKSIDEIQKDN